MDNPWVKRFITVAIFGGLIFGGVKCVGYLTDDSLRASDELYRGVQRNK